MAQAAESVIGVKAHCSDGVCGEVIRVVIDPASHAVTNLVIEPEHRGGPGRLVPLRLLDAMAAEIRLRCTIAEFDQLDPAEGAELAEHPGHAGGYAAAYRHTGGQPGASVTPPGDAIAPGAPASFISGWDEIGR